ncbi:hypothetical protein C3L33_16939, partial [Rhododendron williamsianum]
MLMSPHALCAPGDIAMSAICLERDLETQNSNPDGCWRYIIKRHYCLLSFITLCYLPFKKSFLAGDFL